MAKTEKGHGNRVKVYCTYGTYLKTMLFVYNGCEEKLIYYYCNIRDRDIFYSFIYLVN